MPAPLASSSAEIKIKHKDLRVFNLNTNNLKNNRVVIDSCCIVFTNIYSFKQRVLLLLEVEPDKEEAVNC